MAENVVKVRIAADTAGFEASTRKAETALESLGATAGKVGSAQSAAGLTEALDNSAVAASGLRDQLHGLGEIAIGGAVVVWSSQAISALIDVQRQAESVQSALRFAHDGDMGKVGEDLEWLRGVTERLGIEFTSTSEAFAQFAATTNGTVLAGKAARDIFESVAQASSVMGLSAEQQGGAMLALTQMISKGVVSAEEWNGQLAERMPIATKAAANALGVTTSEFVRMMNAGQLVSSEFLPKFAAELKKTTDATVELGNETNRAVSKLTNSWQGFKQSLADSGVSEFINGQLNILTDAFNGVASAIKSAKAEGAGFLGQMGAGLSSAAKFANPVNAFSYTSQSSDAEIAALKKRRDEVDKNIASYTRLNDLAQIDRQLNSLYSAKAVAGAGNVPGRRTDTLGDQAKLWLEQENAKSAAGQGRINNYLSKGKGQTKDEQRKQLLDGLKAEFTATVAGLSESDAGYQKALSTYVARRKAVLEEGEKRTKAGSIKAVTDNDLASIQSKIEVVKEELAWGNKLNEGEKESLRIRQQLSLTTNSSVRDGLKLKLAKADELANLLSLQSGAKAYADAQNKIAEENARELKQLSDSAIAWENKAKFYGMSESALDSFTLSQIEATIAEKEALATRVHDTGELAKEIELYKKKAELLGRKRDAILSYEGLEDADKAAKQFAEDRKKEAEDLKGMYTGVFQKMEDAMVDFAMGGKTSFKEMINSMIADVIRYQIRSAVTEPLSKNAGSWISQGIGWLGSLFGGSAASVFGTYSSPVPSAANGFDIPAGVNPLTQLHEREMVLPAQYADVIRGLSGGDVGSATSGVTVVLSPTIDARGADAGAVERIEAALSELARNVPAMSVQAVRQATIRNRQTPAF